MKRKLFRRALVLAICFGLASQTPSSKAETLKTVGDELVIAIVAVSAAVVVVVILAVRHQASTKGCVSRGPEGLQITSLDNSVTYQLSGDTAPLRPGELVRLKGKKKSARHNGGQPLLIVSKIGKDYGACPTRP